MIALFLCLALAEEPDATVSATPDEAEAATLPDRTQRPPVLPPEPLQLPEPEKHVLSDGVRALFVPVPGVRHVQVLASIERGALGLDHPYETTRYMGWLADVETGSFEANELSLYEDLHELDVYSSVGNTRGVFGMEVPRYNLDKGLKLLKSVLTEPTFPKKDIALHTRDQLVWYTERAPNDGNAIADATMTFATYPSDHPYGHRPDLEQMQDIGTDDLVALHRSWIQESPVTVIVVGDVAWADVESKLQAVFDGIGTAGERNPLHEVEPLKDTRVIAVDLAGSEQTRIALRLNAPTQDDPDRSVMEVVNFALGGNFLSRLNTNLREEKGFTYGIGSSYFYAPNRAWWTAEVEVAAENTAATVTEIIHEVDTMAEGGLTEQELVGGRNSLVAEWNDALETADTAADFYDNLHLFRLELADEFQKLGQISEITVSDTQRVSTAVFGEDQPRLWVIVGDRGKIESQLTEELGWAPEWIEPKDAILGQF